ncbi:MAG: tRNA (adenosine(37)-N6)-dimethylallyltransferase MiaA [Bacteroidales bacterium]|nr:tRNA (adenosine(37)-N6)-dimethylallyltransferase MiaA [Bacteroidales bacterium]
MLKKIPLITLLGPTATGKTKLAVLIADKLDAEIISADSRQVYKDMDIGTGKDLNEYTIHDKIIPYHLINIVEAGTTYNVHLFVKDFEQIFRDIKSRGKNIVMCGGTGMYIESVLKGYTLIDVPFNEEFRNEMADKPDGEIIRMLKTMKTLHNKTDISDKERMLRALEIETYYKKNKANLPNPTKFESVVFGLDLPRELVRERITIRLEERLRNGMIEEVENLLKKGVTPDVLKYYGLEYKFVSMYLTNDLSYDDMFRLLNTAIHQFAKRQMTWFRRMEKNGIKIHWINGLWNDNKKIDFVLNTLNP